MTTPAMRLVAPVLLSLWFLMAPPAALAQVCSETRDEIRPVAAWYGTGKLSDNSATFDALELSDHITGNLAWQINLLQTDPRVTDDIGDWVNSALSDYEWMVGAAENLPAESNLHRDFASVGTGRVGTLVFCPAIFQGSEQYYLTSWRTFESGTCGLVDILHNGYAEVSYYEQNATFYPPEATGAPGLLWPPDHKFQLITVADLRDCHGDSLAVTITDVTQDEPVKGLGSGDQWPDAKPGPRPDQVWLRAERSGSGDGRIYRIHWMASNGATGTTFVGVPHDMGAGKHPIDSGLVFNSYGP